MGIWEWKEVPKTDKNWQVPLVQKGKKCKWPAHVKKQVGAVNRDWL